jgi:hypothetical protein
VTSLPEVAGIEALRTARTQRGFSLLRAAPAGWSALEGEVEVLASIIHAHLRTTDHVVVTREREVAVVLIEATGSDVHAPLARVREAIEGHLPHLDVRIGWASVGPGQWRTWQEAWRWAGQLLVADAVTPAAA